MEGKVVAVTGAFGALGRVVVAAAIARGASAAAIDSAPSPSPDLVAHFGPGALILPGVNLASAKDAEAAIAAVKARFGRLDVLINIAGGFVYEKTEDGGPESWERMFASNLKSTVNASRAALPALLQSGAGRIVNVGALGALKGGAGMGPYAASKSGVHRFTESLAEELKGRGVTVNAVLPSVIDTPGNRASMKDADFSRWVAPGDLAAIMLFLASAEAGAITGALLPVTGSV
ncbi:MAG: SDR family NAD(P)-dependent oxidoreductase [Bradyrhizobium sp.]|nr:MAG: SDR family NAD(P)-dependent oxidoreductase [Bradyrhizobium sp.]